MNQKEHIEAIMDILNERLVPYQGAMVIHEMDLGDISYAISVIEKDKS